MNLIKKILIALIVIIFSYIIWRLIAKRNNIINQIELKKRIEPFDLGVFTDPAASELNGIKDTKIKIDILGLQKSYEALPLTQYCIKASYNSAFTGKYINLDMLTYLLSRGVRYFDFEVYYITDQTTGRYLPQVGYSTDGNIIVMDSTNTVLLDNALSVLVSGAFSQVSPNSVDPLFINLRIKSNNNDVYKAVASSIDFTLKPALYISKNGDRKVTKDTTMGDIMGKVVLMVDKTINRDYQTFSSCKASDKTCYDLTKYINMETGSETLGMVSNSELLLQPPMRIQIKDDNLGTDIRNMNVVVPNLLPTNASNPDIQKIIKNYGSQIVPFKFYQKDTGLFDYETLFNDNHAGVIPLAKVLAYYEKIKMQTSG